MNKVNINEDKLIIFKQEKIKGVMLNFTLKGAVVNVATAGSGLAASPIDLKEIYISAKLIRGGMADKTLLDGDLKSILKAQHFFNKYYVGVEDNHSSSHAFRHILKAAADGIKEDSSLAIPLEFGTIDMLTYGGKIEVSIKMKPGTFTANTSSDSDESYLEMESIESRDNEFTIPVVKTKSVSNNEENPVYELGDNLIALYLINNNKTGILAANSIVEFLVLSGTDFTPRRRDYIDLLADRNMQFDDNGEADERAQSFCLYHFNQHGGKDLDNVKLELKLNIANVAVSENYLVAYYLDADNQIIQKSMLNEAVSKPAPLGSFSLTKIGVATASRI